MLQHVWGNKRQSWWILNNHDGTKKQQKWARKTTLLVILSCLDGESNQPHGGSYTTYSGKMSYFTHSLTTKTGNFVQNQNHYYNIFGG